MKQIIYSIIFCTILCVCTTPLFSQAKPAKLPMDNKASFETFLKDVYTAYEKQDYKALKNNYYSRMAGEIGPDGSMIQGMKSLEASWKAFDAMVDERPTFTYKLTSSRMVTPEIAIITWDSDADIKMKGQQVGGKTIGLAVLKKKNNSWIIEFDSLTPVVNVPMKEAKPEMMPATPEAKPSEN